MKRKLVKQGAATMMISLPAKWVRKFGLKKGDEVDIQEVKENLIVSKQSIKVKVKETEIKINEHNRDDIKNILTHAYRKGFDRITIKNIDKDTLNIIKNTTNKLLFGFEITEIDTSKCIIENISEPSKEKYEKMLRKIFIIIKDTQEIILNEFKQDLDDFEEVEEMRNQHDKFILLCRRLLMKRKYKGERLLEWELLTFLMHIQHAYYYLYKYSSQNKIKPKKEMIKLLEKLENYFQLYQNAYYKQEIKFIHKINNEKNKYQFGECLKLLQKAKGKDKVVYSYLREIFRLTQIGSSPILAKILSQS